MFLNFSLSTLLSQSSSVENLESVFFVACKFWTHGQDEFHRMGCWQCGSTDNSCILLHCVVHSHRFGSAWRICTFKRSFAGFSCIPKDLAIITQTICVFLLFVLFICSKVLTIQEESFRQCFFPGLFCLESQFS